MTPRPCLATRDGHQEILGWATIVGGLFGLRSVYPAVPLSVPKLILGSQLLETG